MSAKNIVGIVIVIVFSYLLGSINFAIILSSKSNRTDIRNQGSGNAGMTNMLRIYGKKLAIFTAIGDFLKGAVAVLVSQYFILPFFEVYSFNGSYIAALFVLLGHMFPIFFGFKGGKGVMTALGVIMVLNPPAFPILLTIGLVGIILTRIVSVGSLLGAIFFPIITFLLKVIKGEPFLYDTLLSLVIAALVVFMHRSNIRRILSGTENRFGKKNI